MNIKFSRFKDRDRVFQRTDDGGGEAGADIAGFGLSVPEAVMFQGIALVIMIGFSELLYRAAIRRFTAVGA